MIPDPEALSTQQSSVQTATTNPTWNEQFSFATRDYYQESEIHVSLWDAQNHKEGFLGHCSISVADAKPGWSVDRTLTLLPRPNHIKNWSQLKSSKKRRGSETAELVKPKLFVQALQSVAVGMSLFTISFPIL